MWWDPVHSLTLLMGLYLSRISYASHCEERRPAEQVATSMTSLLQGYLHLWGVGKEGTLPKLSLLCWLRPGVGSPVHGHVVPALPCAVRSTEHTYHRK